MSTRRTLLVLLVIAMGLGMAATPAPAFDETDIESVKDVLREKNYFRETVKIRAEDIKRKKEFIKILRERLKDARAERQSDDKSRRVSLFIYQLMMAERELSARQTDVWTMEKMQELTSWVGRYEEREYIEEFLKGLESRRKSAGRRLVKEANDLATLVTDEHIRPQFDELLIELRTLAKGGAKS